MPKGLQVLLKVLKDHQDPDLWVLKVLLEQLKDRLELKDKLEFKVLKEDLKELRDQHRQVLRDRQVPKGLPEVRVPKELKVQHH